MRRRIGILSEPVLCDASDKLKDAPDRRCGFSVIALTGYEGQPAYRIVNGLYRMQRRSLLILLLILSGEHLPDDLVYIGYFPAVGLCNTKQFRSFVRQFTRCFS